MIILLEVHTTTPYGSTNICNVLTVYSFYRFWIRLCKKNPHCIAGNFSLSWDLEFFRSILMTKALWKLKNLEMINYKNIFQFLSGFDSKWPNSVIQSYKCVEVVGLCIYKMNKLFNISVRQHPIYIMHCWSFYTSRNIPTKIYFKTSKKKRDKHPFPSSGIFSINILKN